MTNREIDAAIAEHIMGLKVTHEKHEHLDEDNWYRISPPNDGSLPGFVETVTLPHYSTNIADAWDVVEKINLKFELHYWPHDEKWESFFINYDSKRCDSCSHVSSETSYKGDAYTAPRSICLAALKAKGFEVNETK